MQTLELVLEPTQDLKEDWQSVLSSDVQPQDVGAIQVRNFLDSSFNLNRNYRSLSSFNAYPQAIGIAQFSNCAIPSTSGIIFLKASTLDDSSSERLRLFLGQKAFDRLTELKRAKAGWNLGEGQPLNPLSVVSCLNLTGILSRFPSHFEVRLYLSEEGGLNLVWENSRGFTVMLRCTPTSYLVLDQETGSEQEFASEDRELALFSAGLISSSLA